MHTGTQQRDVITDMSVAKAVAPLWLHGRTMHTYAVKSFTSNVTTTKAFQHVDLHCTRALNFAFAFYTVLSMPAK